MSVHFAAAFTQTDEDFRLTFDAAVRAVTGRRYAGAYSVRPEVAAQTLPTRKRYLEDDLTVQAIPCYSVSNAQGGTTTIIGGSI